MENNRYKNYNNKIGALPFITGAIALAPKIPAISGAISAVTGFLGGIFGGGGGGWGEGYCYYAKSNNCFADDGNWTNEASDGTLDGDYLPGGRHYDSARTNAWGGVLLQVLRAAKGNIRDSRVKQAIDAILSSYNQNNNGKPNYDVLASAGGIVKSLVYQYIHQNYPEFIPRFHQYIGQPQVQQPVQQPVSNGTLPQTLPAPQYSSVMQQPAKSNTLLYVGIGAAVLLGGFLILKKKR